MKDATLRHGLFNAVSIQLVSSKVIGRERRRLMRQGRDYPPGFGLLRIGRGLLGRGRGRRRPPGRGLRPLRSVSTCFH